MSIRARSRTIPTRRAAPSPARRLKDTRAALVEHFKEGHFVHPAALFAPDATSLTEWLAKSAVIEVDEDETPESEDLGGEDQIVDDDPADEFEEGYRDAAE
ncbi:hypothetical protein [Aminobacter ciceronei]|uniref:Uncharacterized protein n=1 Tax=Aminobacter ciceronei TaxID=150723 RepID=A0ABR6C9W0_9HYPH|nr:hypothetical protein [Aminobacter ciceronei]MBA9021803.1 hypothetical protein [Aminobacter ciceronei]